MTALPVSAGESAVREAVERLSTIEPGPYEVVSCYLKLEPRDKARAKYLIKIKNRIKQLASDLERRPLDHAERRSVRADLDRLRRYFEEPSRLPAARGIALFACDVLDLFETLPLPHVHRSRLAVAPVPLVRELVALEEEFGTILVVACDRTSDRFFAVTAYDVAELPSLTALATRAGKFHGERQAKKGSVLAGGFGEHSHHMRIREEKHRHYAQVADRIFQIHTQRPLAGLVAAGIGVDAAALLPHLHTYLHDLVLGVVRLNPQRVAAALRDAGMEVIYTGLHQTPEMIAQAAVQEDVDVVGLSILSGAHLTLFPRVKQLLVEAGRDDVLVTGGGIIPPEDMETLQRRGIGRLFGPGTPTSDLVKYIDEWAAEHVSA